MSTTRPATPLSAGPVPARSHSLQGKKKAASLANGSPSGLSAAQRRRMLTQNYFRCETQFLSALEDISNRLVVVPKQARLSALRAELALIARDLPAEVDIPVICPPTLVDGSPGKSRHHRIVRLNPAEATVLNSAEKVPYLLIVEILRDDFSFDPDTHDNQRLLEQLLAEEKSGAPRRRIFDLSDAPRTPPAATSRAPEPAPAADSVFEPAAGDLGTSTPLVPADDVPSSADGPQPRTPLGAATRSMTPTTMPMHPGRVPSGTTTLSTLSDMTATTPRSSAGGASTSRSSSPGPPMRKAVAAAHMPNSRFAGSSGSLDMQQHPLPQPQQPDFSALATHMRTASQMLAQLEATSGKRPRHEVAAIRAKIIASMQSLEEQSFDLAADADGQGGPNFDLIMAKAAAAAAAEQSQASSTATTANGGAPPEDFDVDMGGVVEPAVNASAAGLARMENDFKTGGVGRKGDRDDPSAAVFGEAWHVKKERIRRSSPYGWMKNWDLVSVIVKTGADLRQEAFACQLISVCDRIWREAGVNVWVKRMRILVTGESSGLIETIANGVSLHSLKRSLTLSSIESGQNPRRRIATLRDHFAKVFGPADSEAYRAGVDAFKQSLAAYSVVSYVLQLKDRHNGNLLIDNEGHIIHIDFGFMLSNSPGSVGFEAAPFKLTHEYVEVLGGLGSPDFEDYKRLCKQAFQALRRSADNIVDLVSMMGKDSKMPCYAAGVVQVTAALRARFMLHLSADEAEQFVENDLIGKSFGSYYTRL